MFVAAYDDRVLVPDYFIPLIKGSTKFCELHLITPAVNLRRVTSADSAFDYRTIHPSSLAQYKHVCKLFDESFVNYSTNPSAFERACFHRWFALNAATIDLVDEEFICLLDTDFLPGMSPDDILAVCRSRTRLKNIQFIAEWDGDEPVAVGPEITLITKSFLHGFCEFLLTTYYSPALRKQLVQEYYDVVGRGLPGGICDMRALAAYAKLNVDAIFNLRNLHEPQLIGNFNTFLQDEIGRTDSWRIAIEPKGQVLHTQDSSSALIGVHFQGTAKACMHLADGEEGEITRALCATHLASKVTRKRRTSNKWKSSVNRLVKLVL